MRKFLVICIPIVVLSLFVLVMNSDSFLKYPLSAKDDMPGSIEALIQQVKEGNWEAAARGTEYLAEAWRIVVKRIQYSAEKDEITDLDMNIARLKGAILAQDREDALLELFEAYEHWKSVGN